MRAPCRQAILLVSCLAIGTLCSAGTARAENDSNDTDYRAAMHQEHEARIHRRLPPPRVDMRRNYERDEAHRIDTEDFLRRFGYPPR